MWNTALACQQNHWRQVTRGDAGSQSFASTRLTSFRVVRHCAQTDNCPSLGYKGGAGLKAWFDMENKGSLQLTTLLFKMLPDWSGMRDNINSHGQEWGIINKHFVADEKKTCIVSSDLPSRSLILLHFNFNDLGELLDSRGLCFLERERNMEGERATTYAPSHSCHSQTWELSLHLKLTISFPLLL